MSDNLLPCPFCGTPNPRYDNCDHGTGKWYQCRGCPARVEVAYGQDLDAAWNRRTGIAGSVPEGWVMWEAVRAARDRNIWRVEIREANKEPCRVRQGTGASIEEAVASAVRGIGT